MEDDDIQPAGSMVPLALAVFGIVLGGAGLYFGLSANQRLNPIDETVSASQSSAAQIEKVINGFETQITELTAQLDEQSKTMNRLRVYSSQSEQAVKKLATELNTNREQIVKTAQKLNEFAEAGFRPAQARTPAETSSAGALVNADASAAAGAATTYVIVAGDNFGKIAAQTGVSLQAILDANPDTNPRRLSIGQTINIPAK
jgi:LysM repeat protein